MKTQRRSRRLYSFFNFGARWGWLVNGTPKPRHLPAMTQYPLYKRLGGPQGRPGRMPPTGKFTNSTFFAHSIFMCFVWISKQRLFPLTALTNLVLWGFAILRKATICFVVCVCEPIRPDGTTRLPLNAFL